MLKNKQTGFTLIEIAIVLLIVSILLGYTVAMAPRQQELKQFKEAKSEMSEVIESLYAFAQVKGYLPCPAQISASTPYTSARDGFECRDINGATALCVDPTDPADPADPQTESCDVWVGAVPGKTLGIDGKYSDAGLLLDPWGNPYRYHITDSDCEENSLPVNNTCTVADDGDGLADFVISSAIKNVTMATLDPDLAVCNAETDPGDDCNDAAERIIENAPVIIWSTGKDQVSSTLQDENNGDDKVYISTSFSDDFDDIVRWISPNILYSKMIEAGKLP